MSSFHPFQWQAVTALAQQLGLAVPASYSAQLFLTLNETLVLSIQPVTGGLLLVGMINGVAAETGTDFWPILLGENLRLAWQGAGSLCLEAESELLLYVERLALVGLGSHALGEAVSRYLATLLTLQARYGAAPSDDVNLEH